MINKINIDPEDTMLNKPYRDRLATRVAQSASPFLTYLGTDLLMHDMGYLSQVAHFKPAHPRRGRRGVAGVQELRAEDSHAGAEGPALQPLRDRRAQEHEDARRDPACDFLLHDGRACDAIEAAFLHDGPAVKKLGVIDGLNALTAQQLLELRAFLYSL